MKQPKKLTREQKECLFAHRKTELLMIITSSSDYLKKNWTILRGESDD